MCDMQDARIFVQSLQYWLGGNAENLENLLLNVAGTYTPALKGVDFTITDPQLFPEVGIWHPLAPCEPTCPSHSLPWAMQLLPGGLWTEVYLLLCSHV